MKHEQALKALQKKLGIGDDTILNVSSLMNLLGPAASGFPTEFLGIGASQFSSFFLTPFATQQMIEWVLPYWVRMQFSPESPSFVPHGHVFVAANVTHRNWTGVGLPSYPNEGSIDPRGLVTPWPFSPSIDFWLMTDKELYCPSELEDVKQVLLDDLPIVVTSFMASNFLCEWTTFAAPIGSNPMVVSIVKVTNKSKKQANASLVIAPRPYNTEGFSAVCHLEYKPAEQAFFGDDRPLAYLVEKPDQVMLSDYSHGDVAIQLRDPQRERLTEVSEVNEPFGLATAAAIYERKIAGGKSSEVAFLAWLSPEECPHPAAKPFLHLDKNPLQSVSTKLEEQRHDWKEVTEKGIKATFPEERYQKAFDVNKTFLIFLHDGDSITPGISLYHMMWFRDASYLVPALERTGYLDWAKEILMSYPQRQKADGFFRSHNGEWDSNGQAMWTLVNHFKMTGDIDFLKSVYPSIRKGAQWLSSKRQSSLPFDDPDYGLLPPGISAEHFGSSDSYYWDDLWAVGGLRAGAYAASVLGRWQDELYMNELAQSFWRCLERSWETQWKRLGRKAIPIAAGRDVDSASIGILAAVYPLDLIDPEDEAMANTVSLIVERCFVRDTHFHAFFHCGINPYLSMHVAQYFLRRRNPYALKIFESLISMETSTHTFPEAINPLTGGGSMGDGHDGWSAADIFNFVRNLLVLEERGKLCLLPLVPAEWFTPGNSIGIEDAPTYYGKVSYSVACDDDSVEFNLPGDFERPPESVEIGIPFAVSECEVDGKKISVPKAGKSVKVKPLTKSVVLKREK